MVIDPASPTRARFHSAQWRRVSALAVGVAVLSLALPATASGQTPDPQDERPSVVVTTPILGWAVASLAGDDAAITVLMEQAIDPHSWEPSARDVEGLHAADLVVTNGSGLEARLHAILDEVRLAGVPVFEATVHIPTREDHDVAHGEEHELDTGHEHDHAAIDPHFWTDPLAMRDVIVALAASLAESGVDIGERADELHARLTSLDEEVRVTLAAVPPEHRYLVTGHESLGYFAERYGFDVVGTVVPGLSSQGDISAGGLAALADVIRETDVSAIFVEVGTSVEVAEAVAAETGAKVVELAVERLPEDGSYETFMRDLATTISEALGSDAAA